MSYRPHFGPHNLVTYVAIAASMTGASLAAPDTRHLVGALLVISVVADLLDGRFARMFPLNEEQKHFGVQIDSLSDVLSFGLAPVVSLFRIAEPVGTLARFGFLACGLVYLVCAVTRLAYYNVTESKQPGFVGVPSTVLGICWAMWLLCAWSPLASAIALVVGGLAMVAPVRIPRPGLKTFVVILVVCTTVLTAHAIARPA